MSYEKRNMWTTLLYVLALSAASSPEEVLFEVYKNIDISQYTEELTRLKANNFSVEDLIKSAGYPVEIHEITNSGGYVLTLHRIPPKENSNGKVAYLQHGLLSSSADWVISGPRNALAYILADEGYDVWMGNARGNSQCRKHISLNPESDAEFWNFSWHEIALVDVPQMIDYILEQTGVDGVYYCGHSQGTTVFYVLMSSLPEYNEKIKLHVSLAPIGFMSHMTSPLMHLMAFWEQPIELLLSLIGINEFLPSTAFFTDIMANAVCGTNSITQILCSNSLFAICGFSFKQLNTTLFPLMMHFTPAGSSTKQFLHYAQEINSGKFRQYDYGFDNPSHYDAWFPPEYDLKKVTAPVFLIYSKNDWLSAENDVVKLSTQISNCIGKILVSDYSFNHLDYMFGIDAPVLVYQKVVSLFSRY